MSNCTLLDALVANLSQNKVRFCHWKSNWDANANLQTSGDLDFLVDSSQRDKFEEIIFSLGFEAVLEPSWAATPGVVHYYGFDQASAEISHLHIYYQLNTAGEILKNYHLNIEQQLLNCSKAHPDGIARPSRPIELILLIVRKLLEHTSPLEFILLLRSRRNVNAELFGLIADCASWQSDSAQYREILKEFFPDLNWEIFNRAALKFIRYGVSIKVVVYALGVARQLKSRRNNPIVTAEVRRGWRFLQRAAHRLILNRRPHKLSGGGRIVAVVGSDASGKSTVVSNLSAWLGENLDVLCIHAGKPPATILTYLPRKLIPLLRRLLPGSRSVTISLSKDTAPRRSGFSAGLFALRALIVAYDRAVLLQKAERARRNGTIVISDRFPSLTLGAMDSAALDPTDIKLSNFSALARFAAIEKGLYAKMPNADCVIRLRVELATALERNRTRIKSDSEGDEWIKFRHSQAELGEYGDARYVVIDTNNKIDITINQAHRAAWCAIAVHSLPNTFDQLQSASA